MSTTQNSEHKTNIDEKKKIEQLRKESNDILRVIIAFVVLWIVGVLIFSTLIVLVVIKDSKYAAIRRQERVQERINEKLEKLENDITIPFGQVGKYNCESGPASITLQQEGYVVWNIYGWPDAKKYIGTNQAGEYTRKVFATGDKDYPYGFYRDPDNGDFYTVMFKAEYWTTLNPGYAYLLIQGRDGVLRFKRDKVKSITVPNKIVIPDNDKDKTNMNSSGIKHYNTYSYDPDDYDDPYDYADDAWGNDFDDWDDAYDYWEDW